MNKLSDSHAEDPVSYPHMHVSGLLDHIYIFRIPDDTESMYANGLELTREESDQSLMPQPSQF